MDVVALARHGIDFSIATLGTATTTDHLNVLFRLTDNVYFCFDGDRAGKAAAWRALENALPQVREGTPDSLRIPARRSRPGLVRQRTRLRRVR